MAPAEWLSVANIKTIKTKKKCMKSSLAADIAIPHVNPSSLKQTKLSLFFKSSRVYKKKKPSEMLQKPWNLANYNIYNVQMSPHLEHKGKLRILPVVHDLVK